MDAIIEGSIKGGIESVSGWEEWFKEKGHIYERVFSDEELAVMVNGKEMKNDADFLRVYHAIFIIHLTYKSYRCNIYVIRNKFF